MVQRFATFAVACRQNRIPDVVERSVRHRIADTLGVSIAAQNLDTSGAAIAHVLDQGGREQAHVIGRQVRVPAAQAAFANGVLAHSLDYDDTHLPSVLHPSASVIPAALAVAEAIGCNGEVLSAGIAAGLEICVRLGMAGFDSSTHNSVFFEYGQHARSICGVIASAAAASVILDLDEAGVAHAMAIAVSFASGVIEGNRTGGTVKRTHCGWAAHGGVTAAQLAARGFTGPPTALEGRFRFLRGIPQRQVRRLVAHRWTRRSLGSPGNLLQAVPRQPLHPGGGRCCDPDEGSGIANRRHRIGRAGDCQPHGEKHWGTSRGQAAPGDGIPGSIQWAVYGCGRSLGRRGRQPGSARANKRRSVARRAGPDEPRRSRQTTDRC